MPRRPNAYKPPVDKPALMRRIGNLPPLGRETATTNDEMRGRAEMLLGVNDSLGRILAALEKAGAPDNTVIVFTSDHGYFYGEHGLNEERRLAYEETIRIPLLVGYPSRMKAGVVASEMVLTIDLAPTLLELAGLTPLSGMQGRSLAPIFSSAATAWRDSFLVEYYSDAVFPRILKMGYSAVRTTKAKYIEYRDLTGMNELYESRLGSVRGTQSHGIARRTRVADDDAERAGAAHSRFSTSVATPSLRKKLANGKAAQYLCYRVRAA